METIYKKDDKVRILQNPGNAADYNFLFVPYMYKYCGKEATIIEVNTTKWNGKPTKEYKLDIDEGWFSWSGEMFEGLAEN